MNYKVEPTETENIFKVTELKEVQILGNGIATIEGNSWLFSKETLQSEIDDFQAEIDKRNEIINLINQINGTN